jgi:hypothetical protein
MKITKRKLHQIIREELSRVDELFGSGKKKTVVVNTAMNFAPGHRFMSGITLAYDKGGDVFFGKDPDTGKVRKFRNLPGHSHSTKGKPFQGHKRNDDGIIYAKAFEQMFGKDAPAPKRSQGTGTQPRPDQGAEVSPTDLGAPRLKLGNGDVYMISADVSVGPDGKRYKTNSEEFRKVLVDAGPGENVGAFQDLINGPQAGGFWTTL